MKESFLITRPMLQSEKVASVLRKKGFEVIIEPISDVKYLKYGEKEVEKLKNGEIQAIFLTSFNSTQTFLDFKFDKNVKIYAVGEKTVQKIRENGYKNINLPEKSNILELEKLFLRQNSQQLGKILYFCGNYLTKDIELSLKEYNFTVEKIESYLIKYRDEFSAQFLDLIKVKKVDNMLCYSKNNARCCAKLVEKYDLWDYFSKINIFAISDEVLKELADLGFEKVEIFNKIL